MAVIHTGLASQILTARAHFPIRANGQETKPVYSLILYNV